MWLSEGQESQWARQSQLEVPALQWELVWRSAVLRLQSEPALGSADSESQ